MLLVDPRGTGRSDAHQLPARSAMSGSRSPPAHGSLAAVGACGRELGSRAGLYGTAAVADDFEAVRAALGLENLDLWGDSYGTYLMPIYAARHPAHVRSMVLSGAAPLEFDPWGRDRLGAARRAIRLVCARTGACRGKAVLRDVERLAARLRRNPVPMRFIARRPALLRPLRRGRAGRALVRRRGAAWSMAALPAAVASALAGDRAPLRRLAETLRARFSATAIADPSITNFAQNFATACHDYPREFSYADSPAARRAAYERGARGDRSARVLSVLSGRLDGRGVRRRR